MCYLLFYVELESRPRCLKKEKNAVQENKEVVDSFETQQFILARGLSCFSNLVALPDYPNEESDRQKALKKAQNIQNCNTSKDPLISTVELVVVVL